MHLARLILVLIVLATTPALAGLPTVQYEGHAYVELERIAQILGRSEEHTSELQSR